MIAAKLIASTCLFSQVPAAASSGADSQAPTTGPVFLRPQEPAAPTGPVFVFAFMPALTFGVDPLPSLELPLFFGARRPGRPWALGYQFTWSSGGAERYFWGLFAHRHHLTAMRGFGSAGRGIFTLGAGVAVLLVVPVVEAEARVLWRFGKRRRGLVGMVSRLGWNFGYGELAPLPQLGLVLGVTTL